MYEGPDAELTIRNKHSRNIELYSVTFTNDLLLLRSIQPEEEVTHPCHVGSSFLAKDASSGRTLLINGHHSHVVDVNSTVGVNLAVVHSPRKCHQASSMN